MNLREIAAPLAALMLGAVAIAACGVVASAFTTPAHAGVTTTPPDAYPACVDADAAVKRLIAAGGMEWGAVEFEARNSDKIRVVELDGVIMLMLTRKGCIMADPLPVDYAKDRGEPA